uniref:Uncharacterized protein n=1 Tax=Paulinella longichromatophora TaxID=1708747 RepID=A0A2H4ZNH0_9EUKA|nr:hypothetical protein PLO_076 [Paulinella longichromatophora]
MEGMALAVYREQSSYLQELRGKLSKYIQMASLHLLTQIVPSRYISLSKEQLHLFEEQIAVMIKQSIPLFTLEHLRALAIEMNELRTTKEILKGPLKDKGTKKKKDIFVNISLESPLDPQLLRNEWNNEIKFSHITTVTNKSSNVNESQVHDSSESLGPESLPSPEKLNSPDSINQYQDRKVATHKFPLQFDDTVSRAARADEVAGLIKLMDLASTSCLDIMNPRSNRDEIKEMIDRKNKPIIPDVTVETSMYLPRDPKQLFFWSKAIDRALKQRLINLSYAINTILVDHGLISINTPKETLYRIASYQIEERSLVPPNIFRLEIPLGSHINEGEYDQVGILLRCDDLEGNDIQLSFCRRSLLRRHHVLKRLIKQHRYWKGRISMIEAQERWFQAKKDLSEMT